MVPIGAGDDAKGLLKASSDKETGRHHVHVGPWAALTLKLEVSGGL
jgi:hypothetical protein